MLKIPRQPQFWLGAFLLWFATLWVLSSCSLGASFTPPLPNFDKLEHFGFFFGGSGLLCAYLCRKQLGPPQWRRVLIPAIVIMALVGGLDEYHQTFTPGRSGNDPFDWLADLLGATAGAFSFKMIHSRLH